MSKATIYCNENGQIISKEEFEHLQYLKSQNHSPTDLTLLGNYKAAKPAATGVKHDSGKPDMSLLSNTALIKIAQVMDFGKSKYNAHNWRGGIAWSRVLAAAFRHLHAYNDGQDKDSETGLSHLAHASCCLMFLLEFENTHPELDDRYKGNK